MKRWDLINGLIQKHGYRRYLEIGVSAGKTFRRIECEMKDSVDPAQGRYDHAEPTYRMTSDEFFSTVAPGLGYEYGLIFIDGLHVAEQVDKDIENSLRFLEKGGTIVLHDCNPIDKARQIVPRIQTAWNGDVWKSAVRFRAADSRFGCLVIDADEGLGVIREDIDSRCRIPVPERLTWEWFEEHREEALGLISPERFVREHLAG